MKATEDQGAPTKGRGSGLESRAIVMFADCLKAFHAFAELSELAENLRILSLNAELAAGRAGEKGRAVRALTQYTRELVNRLHLIQRQSGQLMQQTYTQLAGLMREMHQVRLLAAAEHRVAATGNRAAAQTIGRGRSALLEPLRRDLSGMVSSTAKLEARIAQVAEVVSAADSIATNIAIEATAAGVHETEFRTVADTMRRYVLELRKMTDDAGSAARSGAVKGERLERAAQSNSAAF
ncbi:MAG: hypothetical protein K9G59_19070 [Caulobacter sp.]|nr:hypothetical protein [Caulobacter sp.]